MRFRWREGLHVEAPSGRWRRRRRCLWAALVVCGSHLCGAAQSPELEQRLREMSRPLERSEDLDPLLAAAQEARVVLLGEATHGTREFYEWRARLTRRLIVEQGVRMIGIEGDWRPTLGFNAFLRGDDPTPDSATVLRRIEQWPQWMWANAQFAELLAWIRDWNRGRAPAEQVQLYGLDLYGLRDSLAAVESFISRHMPARLEEMRNHYEPLRKARGDGSRYVDRVARGGRTAELGVSAVVDLVRNAARADGAIPEEERFAAEQDAWVVHNAEAFYRAVPEPNSRSWNVRVRHMWETAERLLARAGANSRLVVWAHNTHVGDARATDMKATGAVNIGQLSREALGAAQVFIVGFATYRGEAIAARSWGGRRRALPLPVARAGSWDSHIQRAIGDDGWFLLRDVPQTDPLLRAWHPQRAVGVVYEPRAEATVNYTNTLLPERFDALLFISETHALAPLR